MKVVLVNDDGIDASGIRVLAQYLSGRHEVYIAAPMYQKSCYSHSVTYFYQNNGAEKREIPGVKEAWAIDATPADCSYYALNGLLDIKPDLLISGINIGPNLSSDTIYSGTVGAASEGMINGIPSIAVSICSHNPEHLLTAARVTEECMEIFVQDELNHSYVLNINVPDLPYEDLKGIKETAFAGTLNYRRPVKILHNTGKEAELTIENRPFSALADIAPEGSDTKAVREGYVSITPVNNDIRMCGLEEQMDRYLGLLKRDGNKF